VRTTIAALALLLLAPLPAEAAPASERQAPDAPAVTGYALPSTRPAIVRRDADALTTLTVAAVSLRPSGAAVTDPDPRTLRLVEVAHRQGLRAELLRVWWSDGRSYDVRASLAADLGLRGTAIWRLGSAGPLT
jgi:spore germination protein